MTDPRHQLKSATFAAIGLTAVLVLTGTAMTAYALVGLERGSSLFTATLLWAQVFLMAGAVIGVGAVFLKLMWPAASPAA
ncbi:MULTISPECIES: hypothetical protein [Microbacterium]|uniref:Uncharacterized protein n=1 Tax=Microbacterium azadirachtae TaxID=582680 RepID=A0A0F0LFZ9_9MICO|nr:MULTISPECIES: hypothetical protein [Microbacterium]KJL32157.1 hypothetical protein RS86_02626 [Microbacterium azadirachtae]PRB05882.1 hypothetical protein CQ044_09730 [Microbacterium sp. MYb64]